MADILGMIVYLAVIAGVIALQIFLSKKQNKWVGLILPLICLTFSIFAALSIPTYFTQSITESTVSESGEIVNNVVNNAADKNVLPSPILTTISVFWIYNIPTAILLAIYFAYREKLEMKKELEKMNIRDL